MLLYIQDCDNANAGSSQTVFIRVYCVLFVGILPSYIVMATDNCVAGEVAIKHSNYQKCRRAQQKKKKNFQDIEGHSHNSVV